VHRVISRSNGADFTSSKRAQGHEVNLLPDADLHEDWWILLRITRLDPIWRIFPAQSQWSQWSQRCGSRPVPFGPSVPPHHDEALVKKMFANGLFRQQIADISLRSGVKKFSACFERVIYAQCTCRNIAMFGRPYGGLVFFWTMFNLKCMALVFLCLKSMVSLWFYHGSCYRKLLQLLQRCFHCFTWRRPLVAKVPKPSQGSQRGRQSPRWAPGAVASTYKVTVHMFSGKQTPPRTTREFPHVFDVRVRVSSGVLWIEVHGPRRSLKQRWSNVVDREICQVQRYMFATNCVCNTTWWDTWRSYMTFRCMFFLLFLDYEVTIERTSAPFSNCPGPPARQACRSTLHAWRSATSPARKKRVWKLWEHLTYVDRLKPMLAYVHWMNCSSTYESKPMLIIFDYQCYYHRFINVDWEWLKELLINLLIFCSFLSTASTSLK
jgi:hypothetical protein